MNHIFAAVVLMYAFTLTASAAAPPVAFDLTHSCQLMADEKQAGGKTDGKKADEEPDCE